MACFFQAINEISLRLKIVFHDEDAHNPASTCTFLARNETENR
jgi:hypothetical protein